MVGIGFMLISVSFGAVMSYYVISEKYTLVSKKQADSILKQLEKYLNK